MILHLVSRAEWNSKPVNQPYVPDTFNQDGFIHCTQGDELLLDVANRLYRGIPGTFLVLNIDETKVTAPIKWESPTDGPPNGSSPDMTAPETPPAPATTAAKPDATQQAGLPAGASAPKTGEPPPEAKAEFGSELGAQSTPPPASSGPALPAAVTQLSPPPSPALPAAPAPQLFPHIYGPLNRDAIVGVRRMVRERDGTFTRIVMLDGTPPVAAEPQAASPPTRLKTPSEMANELLAATDDFSEALAHYKDKIESHIDELDKNIKKDL